MVYVGDIGNISHKQVLNDYFSWTVANVLSLLHPADTQIVSPVFHFENQQCALGLETFKVGDRNEDWIGINFWILPKNYQIHVKLGAQSPHAEEYVSFTTEYVNTDNLQVPLCKQQQFLRRSEVDRVLRDGNLTVFCEVQKEASVTEAVHHEDIFDGILAA